MSSAPSPLSELRGKSLLIFDDGLISKDGHWFEIDKAIAHFHADHGVRVTIVTHVGFGYSDELVAQGVRVLPLIKQSLWTGWLPKEGWFSTATSKVRLLDPVREWAIYLKQARHFRKVLVRLLRKEEFDCVLHPSAMVADLLAWAMIPRKLRLRAGRVALLTRFGVGAYSATQPPLFARKLVVWRWLTRWLGSEFKSGRFVLLTDSERLADEYTTVSGVRPNVLCSPRAMSAAPSAADRPSWLTFGTLGAARIDKGIHLLQSAIERLIADGAMADLRFLVQWNRRVANDDGSSYDRSTVLEVHPQVRFLNQVISSADYDRLFLDIDCMVLPYRRALYHSQISGVAVEAACAGIPMIYTADTWLSDFVGEQGAGISVADGDAEGLAQAILAMAADYPAFKARAVERSAIARARNSPEAFARVLWGVGPDARVAGSAA